ncbi:unnamed protein product, partial [Porites evermanni]
IVKLNSDLSQVRKWLIKNKLLNQNSCILGPPTVSAGIGAMRCIKNFVPVATLETVYKGLVQPYFEYCSPLWDTCGKLLKDKLQQV